MRRTKVSEWALHIDTDWRFLIDDKEVASHREVELRQADEPKLNWFASPKIEERPKVISVTEGHHFADFDIRFENGISISAYAGRAEEIDDEYWRLFRPYKNSEHVVVRASGVFAE